LEQETCVFVKQIPNHRILQRFAGKAWLALILLLACAGLSIAGGPPFNTTVPGDIMSQFRSQRTLWTTNVWVYANNLFGILALIEFTWSAAVMLLERSDLQTWTAALVRKIMWIGAFYALLINGRFWIPAIIDSFTKMGAGATGLSSPLNPGNVFGQGLMIAGGLMDSGASSAFFTKPGTSLALIFAAIIIMLSYIIITLNYIVTFVESYLVISVGFVFLGFGGSRWTVPYTERFIGLAVAIGVKILLLYCLISAGFNLGVGWMTEATSVGTAPYPAMTAFDVMGGAVIFMMCCWQIPKLFSAVLGGAPALTGGDLISTTTAIVAGTAAAGSLALGGIGLAGGAAGAAAGAGSAGGASGSSSLISSVASARSAGGGSVPPPASPTPSAGALSHQPAPPSFASRYSSLAAIGGEPLAGSGFESERAARGFASPELTAVPTPTADEVPPGPAGPAPSATPPSPGRQTLINRVSSKVWRYRNAMSIFPSDSAPHATPPRMPVDQNGE
jgi:type IV secretion system protein TrbL